MRSLEVIGERWTLLVVREAFFGVRRFEAMLANIGCARNILSARLASLVKQGVMAKVAYGTEGQRARFEYRLTEKGHALYPVILSLKGWGDDWLSRGAKTPSLLVQHRDCGAAVTVHLHCTAGHHIRSARETVPTVRGR